MSVLCLVTVTEKMKSFEDALTQATQSIQTKNAMIESLCDQLQVCFWCFVNLLTPNIFHILEAEG